MKTWKSTESPGRSRYTPQPRQRRPRSSSRWPSRGWTAPSPSQSPGRERRDPRRPTRVSLIAKERERQVQECGHHPDADDKLMGGELAWAAACYAAPRDVYMDDGPHYHSPWPGAALGDDKSDQGSRIRQLTKAGALIAAELDRLIKMN